eukprot:jgi/Tetstr1/452298/TSEL_039334.t1
MRCARIARVAGLDIGKELVSIDALAACLDLAGAAVGADFGIGDDKELGVGFGGDRGADIAAIEHGAERVGGEIALEGKEGFAHAGEDGDP